MSGVLNIAVTALEVANKEIQVIANNVANVRTTGFKKMMVQTSDLDYSTLKRSGINENANAGPRPVGVQIGAGSKVDGTFRVLEQGGVINTSQPLDIMIKGPGYFAIGLPNGLPAYTRDGAFKLNPNTRQLVTLRGDPLEDNIVIPDGIEPEKVSISADGVVTGIDAQNNQVDIGQITLWTFPNEKGLEAIGDNLLSVTLGSGEALQIADITNKFQQGYLEGSNVSAVRELTALIEAQRGYELAARVVKTADEMEQTANQIKS